MTDALADSCHAMHTQHRWLQRLLSCRLATAIAESHRPISEGTPQPAMFSPIVQVPEARRYPVRTPLQGGQKNNSARNNQTASGQNDTKLSTSLLSDFQCNCTEYHRCRTPLEIVALLKQFLGFPTVPADNKHEAAGTGKTLLFEELQHATELRSTCLFLQELCARVLVPWMP